MWLKLRLGLKTGSLLASRPTGRRRAGRATREGKDLGGSDGWTGIHWSWRRRKEMEQKINKREERKARGGRIRKTQLEDRKEKKWRAGAVVLAAKEQLEPS